MRATSVLSVLIAAAVAVPAAASAQVLSNLTAGTSGGGTTLGLQQKAVGLAVGANAYTFTSLRAVFSDGGGLADGVVTGGIYSDVGSNPGTLLAAFTSVSVPLGASNLVGTFTTASPFALAAGSTFWFVLNQVAGTAPLVNWVTTSAAPTAATGVTSAGYRLSSNGGTTWTTSALTNRVEINATAATTTVPEPGTSALLATGVAGLGLLARRRRRPG